MQHRDEDKRKIGTKHENLAVCEINQLNDAVNHCIAYRDERVDAAKHQPINKLL